MAKALTLEEKVARANARVQEQQTNSEPNTSSGGRRKRNTFNGTQGKLMVNPDLLDPEYHYHILNDAPGRIQAALDNGYVFVSPEEIGGISSDPTLRDHNTDLGGDKVRYLVGQADNGSPFYAYLMKQKKEWYDEDQSELQKRNDMVDISIRRGKGGDDGASTDGFYMPKGGGIKMNFE